MISDTFDGYMVLDADRNSKTFHVPGNFVAVQLVWTGDAVGTIYIQESWNKGNHWATLQHYDNEGAQSDGIAVSSADDTVINLLNTRLDFLRVKYVRTSGTGGLSFYVFSKTASFGPRVSSARCWRIFTPAASAS